MSEVKTRARALLQEAAPASTEAIGAGLRDLGLTGYAADAFCSLARVSEATAGDLVSRTGIPDSKIYYALDELAEKGLVEVQAGKPKTYRAIPAREAEGRLARLLEEKHDRERATVKRVASLLEPLRAAARSPITDLAYIVKGLPNVTARARSMIGSARKEIVLLASDVPLYRELEPELVRVATALGTTGRSGYVFQGKQYEGLVVNFLEILWAMGGRLLGEDGGVAVDSPAGVRALEILAALLRHPGAASPGVLTYAEHDSLQEFLEGRALMHRNWSFAWSLVEREGSRVRGRVGVAPLPGPASLGGWHLAVSAYSRHPAAAWALARFLTSAEAQRVKALVEGRLPTVGALYDDREVLRANPHFAALRDALALARPRPATPFYARLSGILQVQISRALVGVVSPREALAEATRQMAPLAGARSAGLPR